MVQRFFLDRVYTKAGRPPVADQFDLAIEALANITNSPLTLAQATVPRTEVTLNAAIIEEMPVSGCDDRSVHSR